MIGIYWNWSPWWYLQIAIGLFIWLPLFLFRKSWKKKNEISEQIFFGFVVLGINLLSDTLAIFTNIWHYTSGDWPALLWVLMFLAGLTAFQLFKFIDERWGK